jgi:hypothetical protein
MAKKFINTFIIAVAGIKKDSLDNLETVPGFVPLLLPFGSLDQSGSFPDEPSNA